MSALSSSDRILAACCPDSAIDVFEHAAQVTGLVSDAHLREFRRTHADLRELDPHTQIARKEARP